jgi:hypothetical protein
MSADEHEDHGNTPAAWTTVILMILGFTIGGAGMIVASVPLFVAGVVVVVLGPIVGKILSMMGLGKKVEQPAS